MYIIIWIFSVCKGARLTHVLLFIIEKHYIYLIFSF